MVGGETRKTTLSEFASCVAEQDTALFQRKLPQITKDELELFGKLLMRPVPTSERVQKSLKEFRRVQRLRDHELDAPDDPDEAPTPVWKYTRGDSPGANWSGPASTSHEGFTSLSLASVAAFGNRKTSGQKKFWPKSSATDVPKLGRSTVSNSNIKGSTVAGVAVPAVPSITRHPAKAIPAQPRPPSTVVANSSTSLRISSAPPKPANSAFRPPTFIAPGTTPNSASVAGVKRRLGMGHLAGGSLSIPKARRVDKDGKAAGGG
ncbi:hypothetical protein FRC06_000524 [Ceratobasidium sp. 370]|nr:hypothetical protein FRC06_000524 [Ceratobasidium sp. 370]